MMLGATPRFYTAMVLQMSRPHKHPKTGVFYFRQKVPADLRAAVGKSEVSWSLRTKSEDDAKLRHSEALRKQSLIWQAMRATPEPIPHKQLVALAGVHYRSLVEMMEDEPGEVAVWTTMLEKLSVKDPAPEAVEKFFGADADRLFQESGLSADSWSRSRLCQEMLKVWLQWSTYQLQRAQGDYSPDPKANRFPEVAPSGKMIEAAPEKPQSLSISALFDLWERDHLASLRPKKTADDFRQKMDSLRAFLGHDDAAQVTGENISDWCDWLRHEQKLAAKTVRDKYLAAAKAVFNIGVGKRKLTINPTEDVKVSVPKKM